MGLILWGCFLVKTLQAQKAGYTCLHGAISYPADGSPQACGTELHAEWVEVSPPCGSAFVLTRHRHAYGNAAAL